MPMFCTQCGQQNVDDASFCDSCGAPLTSPSVSQRTAPSPSISQRQAQGLSKSKSRVLVVVFSVIAIIAIGGAVAFVVPGGPLSGVFAKLGAGLPVGGSVDEVIQAQYNKEAAAARNKDIDGVFSINTSDYTFTNRKGQQRSLNEIKDSATQIMAQAQTAEISNTVEKVTVKGDTAVVIVSEKALVVLVNPQTGNKTRMEQTDRREDVWVKRDGVWKRQKSRELSGEILIDGKPPPETQIAQRESSSEIARMRSKTVEVILSMSACRTAITEKYQIGGRAPVANQWGCEHAASSKYVGAINTNADGVITATVDNVDASINGLKITLVPLRDESNMATWSSARGAGLYQWLCGGPGTTVPADLLPSSCRGSHKVATAKKSLKTAARTDNSRSIFDRLGSVFSSSRSSLIGTWIADTAAREEWIFREDGTILVKDPIFGEIKGTWMMSSGGDVETVADFLGGKQVFNGALKGSILKLENVSFQKKGGG